MRSINFMDSGAISKRWYRYQDWCAMYVLLNHYSEDEKNLDFLNFENGKIDFEAWLSKRIENYQVKGGDIQLTAEYLNSVFQQHLLMTDKYSPIEYMLFLIFCNEPKHSLRYLINKLSGNKGVKKYHRKTQDYINTALRNLDQDKISVTYRCFSEEEIQCICWGIAKRILEQHNYNDMDLPPGVVDNFISRLREEIDRISSQPDISDRRLSKQHLVNLISRIRYPIDSPRGRKIKRLIIKDRQISDLNISPMSKNIGTVDTENHE